MSGVRGVWRVLVCLVVACGAVAGAPLAVAAANATCSYVNGFDWAQPVANSTDYSCDFCLPPTCDQCTAQPGTESNATSQGAGVRLLRAANRHPTLFAHTAPSLSPTPFVPCVCVCVCMCTECDDR